MYIIHLDINHAFKLRLQYPFGAGNGGRIVSLQSHFNSLGHGLENGFNLMVFVIALAGNIERRPGVIGEGLKEVEEQFGRQIPNSLALKIGIPHQPRPAGKVDGRLSQGFIHW